jgi:anthranilate synthase component 1
MKRAFVPDFEAFCELAEEHGLVPVYAEQLGDLLTPVAAALRLADHVRRPFLLESADGGESVGRYSYLGGDPFLELVGDAAGITLRPAEGAPERLDGDPIAALAAIDSRYRAAVVEGVPPFAGGAVGYVGYAAARWVEDVDVAVAEGDELPWCWLGYYDTILAFDHLKHRVKLVSNAHVAGCTEPDQLRAAYDAACDRIEYLAELLLGPGLTPAPLDAIAADECAPLATRSSVDETEFTAAVDAARQHILAGDAFQIVLSRRLECDVETDPLTAYRALRAINPSPYMYCLDTGTASIVGSSPEMLVRVEDGIVETRPIAGTRGRDPDPARDAALAEDLLADGKECAEHLMLVDLGRNDVGRVARYGGVEVPEFMRIERYSHVMHIVSTVRGALRDDVHPLEAMFASFPAGTVSGAPKIRAMEIINALESSARGVYAGAILYSDFAGNLNSCIAIRTLVMRDGVAEVRAGAGIVIESDAAKEFEETAQKAAAPLQALAWAEAASQRGRGAKE